MEEQKIKDGMDKYLPTSFIWIIAMGLMTALIACAVYVVYDYQMNDSFTLCLIIGVLNSLVGSFLSASGYCCQKWAHNQARDDPSCRPAVQQPIYIAGLFLLAIGTISAVVNLGLLGQTVQAPFAALTLIYNALLAHTVLKEVYSRYDFYSSLLIIGGVAISVFGAELSDVVTTEYDLKALLQLYIYDSMLPPMYTMLVVFIIVFANRFIQLKNLQDTAVGLFSFSLLAGLMSGFTSLTVKSTIEIIKGVVERDTDDFHHWTTYGIMLLIPCCLYPQLVFMNRGLQHFGTLKFVPLYQSFIILANMLSGVVYFNEMAQYTIVSKVFFLSGCCITLLGVWSLLAKVDRPTATLDELESLLQRRPIDIHQIPWVASSHGVEFLMDFGQCKRAIVKLFSEAQHSIYYSTFLCDFSFGLPGYRGDNKNTTMIQLIQDAVTRGVRVHILYNPVLDYGTSNIESLLEKLPKEVNIHSSTSNLGPSWLTRHFSSNSRYAFHHQKYLCVDGEIPNKGRLMVTGCDVNQERNAWLVKNGLGYFWHELSVVTTCTTEMFDWIYQNHHASVRAQYDNQFQPAPFPLVNGGWQEENVMVDMILKAQHSIHLENQIFISGSSEQENRISAALVERIARGIREKDDFRALIVTNAVQQDEPSQVTRWYCVISLEWSLTSLNALAQKHGLSRAQLHSRLIITRLEHAGTLIKVHSNFIIQDGEFCIRTSSNLADRSLSHRPCDAETGLMVRGQTVEDLQQALFNMYFYTADEFYTMKQVFDRISQPQLTRCLHRMEPRGWRRLPTRFLMLFFVYLSEGATGGRYKVQFDTQVVRP